MKHLKHIIATVAALFVALVVAAPAFAADSHSITVKSDDTHTYKVYQVLTGTLASEGSLELGNPDWGDDVIAEHGDVNAFIASLAGKSESEVAAAVSAKVNLESTGQGTVDKSNPLTGLETGYYVLVDVTDLSAEANKNDTKSINVVKVVNDVEFDKKWDTTSDDKKIVSDTLGNGTDPNTVNGQTNNVSVGDTVNYQITAKVPENATDYNYFFFIVKDTLSEGLSFNNDIHVYHGTVVNGNEIAAANYELKTGDAADPNTFQLGLKNAKQYAGEDIIVVYSATVNENAKVDGPNPNTSTVEFSRDPNHNYDGTNNPGFPADKDKPAMGETPETKTETYTTGIEIKKVDQAGNVLTGAEFTITGDSTQIVLVTTEVFKADATGDYYKLKDGTYTKDEPTAQHMEPAAAGATEGYVEEDGYTGTGAITVGNKTYRPVTQEDIGAGTPVYTLVNSNEDLYESTTQKYKKDVELTQKNTANNETATAEVDENGIVKFIGLGAGTYTITETKTPDGYNTIAPLTLKIQFDKDGTPKWSKSADSTEEAEFDATSGLFKLTIKNTKGTALPETGGMGTTVLYAAGAALVVLGGIFLVTKKRMGAAE